MKSNKLSSQLSACKMTFRQAFMLPMLSLVLSFIGVCPVLADSEAKLYHFDFKAQPLADALTQFARVVGQTLIYNPAHVADLVASPILGEFNAEQAIIVLLRRSPFTAQRLGNGWVIKNKIMDEQALVIQSPKIEYAKSPVLKLPTEVIEISGFRHAINQAKDIKREALISQDSIVAEDIADFPDLNLADSLQRIPGVTITREGGEGRQISLRGLGPDFTRVQVNGMEALGNSSSPMDARGAVSRTRAFDFNIFAAELFKQIDVKKSYSANQEEGGIGGTVNLKTAQPFDFKGFKSVVSAQLGSNTNSTSRDPRLVGLISNTWRQFGLLVSVAYSHRDTMEYGTNTTRWRRETGKIAVDANDTDLQALLDSGELWFPRGQRYSLWNNNQQRLGLTTSIQYKAADKLSFAIDYLHGKLKNHSSEHHLAVKDNEHVKTLEWLENSGTKQVVYASYQNATWRSENTQHDNQTSFDQATLRADWSLTSLINMRFLLGTSASRYAQPNVNKVNIQAEKKVDITTDFRQDHFYGFSLSPGFDLNSGDAFAIKDLYFQEDYISNSFDNVQLDFDYFVGDSGTLKWGLNYKIFENGGEKRTFEYSPDSSVAPLSTDLITPYIEHPDIDWVQGSIAPIQQWYGLADLALGAADIRSGSNFGITEKTRAAYVLYNWQSLFNGQLLSASVGARVYQTKLTSRGMSQASHVEQVRNYAGILPSFNVVFELTDDILWRFSANKNLTRPSLSDLSYSVDVSQTSLGEGEIGDITIGNPDLRPYESLNLDSAFEWYFEKLGMLSVAGFYKDIKHFIVSESTQRRYSELTLPAELLPTGKTVDDIFNVISPHNSDTTTIKGIELAIQRDLNFLPAPFDNLGVIANYTYANGSNLYRNVGDSGQNQVKSFPGLSKHSYNLTLYYETERWGARMASTYRSAYLIWAGKSQDDDERGYHATTHYDFSAFYHLSTSTKVNFEAINLSNVREELYSDVHHRAYNTTTSGRTYMFGLTMQF